METDKSLYFALRVPLSLPEACHALDTHLPRHAPQEMLSTHAAARELTPVWGHHQVRHGQGLHSAEWVLKDQEAQISTLMEALSALPDTEPPERGHGATGQPECARDWQVGQSGPGSEERPTPPPMRSLQTHKHHSPSLRLSWLHLPVLNPGRASCPIWRIRVAPGHWKDDGSG